MAQKYSQEELKTLREQCKTRLPPASAMQAMYLYELEREAENEKLFHDLVFQNARLQDASDVTNERLTELERLLKSCAERHGDLRTISQNGANAIVTGLKTRVAGLSVQDNPKEVRAAWSWLMTELKQKAKTTEEQIAFTAVLGAIRDDEVETALRSKVDDLSNEFSDVKSRMAKLEDLVRVLTVQRSSAGTPSPMGSPKVAQRLPVTSSDGQTLDLNVPKGVPLIPLKEYRATSGARTAFPSKPSGGPSAAASTWTSADIKPAQPTSALSALSAVDQWGGPATFESKPLPPPPTARSSSPAKPAIAAAAPVKAFTGSNNWSSAPSEETQDKRASISSSTWKTKSNAREAPIKAKTGPSSWDTAPLSSTPTSLAAPPSASTSSRGGDSRIAPVHDSTSKAPITATKGEETSASKGKTKKWKEPPIFDASAADFAGAVHTTDLAGEATRQSKLSAPKPAPVSSATSSASLTAAPSAAQNAVKSLSDDQDRIKSPRFGFSLKPPQAASSAAQGKYGTQTAEGMKQQTGHYITSTSPKPQSQAFGTVPRTQSETKRTVAASPPKAADTNAEGTGGDNKPAKPEHLSVPTPSKTIPPASPTKTAQEPNTMKENLAPKSSHGLSAAAPSFTPTSSSPSITRRMTPAMEALFKAHMATARAKQAQ